MRTIFTSLLLILSLTALDAQRLANSPKVNYDWKPGFVSITEFSGAIGIGITDVPFSKYYYGISTMAAYQFTRNIKAGAGVGIQTHNGGTLFPVFVDARVSFNAQELVPFISASGGLGVNFGDIRNQSYVYVNPSAGIRWVAASRKGISLSGGLMMMSGEFTRNTFINFKLGLELKTK